MIVDKINGYLSQENLSLNEALRYEVEKLAGVAFRRQFQFTENNERKAGVIRLSSAGKCARQLAYQYHGYEPDGKELDSRAKVVFFMGDLTELMIISLAKLAGCNVIATGLNQMSLSITIDGVEIEGHPDGLLSADRKFRLIEVKSMPKLRFERFEKGVIDETYLAQVNIYLEALGLDECIMVALNKDSGVLGERLIKKDPRIVAFVRGNIHKVLKSTKENLPPRAFQPDEKGFYPWNCLYCPYWKVCLPNAERVLVGKSYKLREKGIVNRKGAHSSVLKDKKVV